MTTPALLTSAIVVFSLLPGQNPPAASPPPAAQEFKTVAALTASLPAAKVTPLDAKAALVFSALPLVCIDDLQARPGATTKPYFWQPTYKTIDGYEKTRAFYGCGDWATSVSATWTLVALLKQYPDVGTSPLVREKLSAHLGRTNFEGELAYFRAAGNAQRPYGYAWFLRLYAALATWKDADGARYAENAAPLARYFVDGIVSYLVDLERPNRAATQANSALSLGLLLDYVDATRDMTVKRAVTDAARRLFLTDVDCKTSTEAASPEAASPCLEEASVMSRALDAAAFTAWFDKFMPAPETAAFAPLRSISFDATGARGRGEDRGGARGAGGRGDTANAPAASPRGGATNAASSAAPVAEAAGGRGGAPQTDPRANWIGLAFTRANAYAHIASTLPASDPRVAVYRRLADIHAAAGQREVVTPAAFDAPWAGALAVSYLTAIGGAK